MKNVNILLSLILFGLVLGSCGKPDKAKQLENLKKQRDDISAQIKQLESELNPADTAKKEMVTTDVLTTELKTQVFDHFIEVQGKVDGEQNVGIAPQMPGIVTSVFVKEGSMVTKGQVLAQLDDNVLRQQLKTIEQQLSFATDLYNKQKSLWDQQIGTEVQYLSAKNQKESLEKNIAAMKEQLQMYKIKSPINGSVEEVNIKVGQMAAAGVLPSFRVVNFSSVKVVADIAEAYAPKVKSGNKAVIYFPDYDTEIPAVIRFSSKFINPTNRTFQAEVKLGKSKIDYRANMIAIMKINDYHNPKAFVLPVNAIKESTGGQYVYIAEGKGDKTIAKKTMIETGQTYNGMAEVTKGLKQGDRVITTGQNNLSDGQVVNISQPVIE
ncbi:MAG: efflux RND transporter periplasmic adaptor subunit [Deltaproteobacteria bacterium]